MPRSEDDYRPRRTRSPESPDLDPDRRRRDRDEEYDSRRSEHRSSRDDRRHYSRSPSGRDSRRRDDRRRERRERSESFDGDRRRRRSSSRDRHRRRHRDRDDEFDARDRDRASRRHRSTSRSRSPARRRRSRSRSPARDSRGALRSKGPLPSQKDAFSTEVTKKSSPAPPDKPKEKPNFSTTGRLAAESNTVNVDGTAVVLKYHEPPEARKPPAKDNWRLYVFKGSDLLEMVELSERSCWLIGRERLVVDFPVDHPSCSKQHAAIQFRYVEKRNEFGDRMGKVRPYLIDLESANGSTVNGDPVPPGRYVELRDKDVLKFGLSTREYVLMLPPAE
ncbi:hypothetical protein VTN00DRAFT_1721 [Thermoascus crustaceus]|uniref:uncharacterized protein n=1 Tax=Thermoascus crustaceus TaxID=5088 RepID=UPI0037443E95